MPVPGRMERKQWGKSFFNLLLKTKVSSHLLCWSTGTNRNSSPLRVLKWGFLQLCLISFLNGRSEGNSVAADQSCWHCKTQLFFKVVSVVRTPSRAAIAAQPASPPGAEKLSEIDVPRGGYCYQENTSIAQVWSAYFSLTDLFPSSVLGSFFQIAAERCLHDTAGFGLYTLAGWGLWECGNTFETLTPQCCASMRSTLVSGFCGILTSIQLCCVDKSLASSCVSCFSWRWHQNKRMV